MASAPQAMITHKAVIVDPVHWKFARRRRDERMAARLIPTRKWRPYSQKRCAGATGGNRTEVALAPQATRSRCRSVSQIREAAAAMMTGKTTPLTALQPAAAKSWPDEKEAIAMAPNTRKSLNACTLLRSSER